MSNYPHTKTLIAAKPTVRISDNFATSWDIEVEYTFAGDAANDLPAWSKTYSHNEVIESPIKAVGDYTKNELIALMPEVISDHVFGAHYEAYNIVVAVEEEVVADFDVNSLS